MLLDSDTAEDRLTVSERIRVCCRGVFASQTAYVLCVALIIAGWCAFIGDLFWTQRHVLPPYRFRFAHFVPGLLMSAAAVFIMFASMLEDTAPPDLFGDDAPYRYRRSIAWATFCLCCSMVPVVIAGLVFHATWYDHSALDTRAPPPQPPPGVAPRVFPTLIERDESFKRGIFSSISGLAKTTPPPTTPPPPNTWPPFDGPAGVPAWYIFHVVCMLGALCAALTAKIWREQERAVARRDAGDGL